MKAKYYLKYNGRVREFNSVEEAKSEYQRLREDGIEAEVTYNI